MNRVVEWQLGHPNGIEEECKTWLQEENVRKALGDLPTAADEDGSGQRKKRKVAKESTAT
jgi:hypothetical protein